MLKALRGTKDILPGEVNIWQHIEASARNIFAIYGYREIRTPVIEEASLFIRSIGDNTDIVQKEMYVFSDRGGRTIALRPEATASVARAFIENYNGYSEALAKFFYIGPMFRSERPQKGRQRQFHQLGVEAIGSDNPLIDTEVMVLAVRFLERLQFHDFIIKINSLGCKDDKEALIEKYRKSVKPHLTLLCDDCRERADKNVLRVFDCKNEKCRDVIKGIKFENLLCKDCAGHFEVVQKALGKAGIKYIVDPKIVRGLDYYTKTVFEIAYKGLGAKDAICAGGRYNNLIQELGGKNVPAVGFSFGIERLVMAAENEGGPKESGTDIFIVTTGEDLKYEAFLMMNCLRDEGISCDMEYEKKSLKAQMRRAEKMNASFVIIVGEEESGKGMVVLRDMRERAQREIKRDDIVGEMKERIIR